MSKWESVTTVWARRSLTARLYPRLIRACSTNSRVTGARSRMKGWTCGLTVLAVSCALLGCQDDCADAAAAADKFLEDPHNLSCEANVDCTVVFTGCAPVTNS